MTVTMISPFSGAPEQQDLTPLGGNQEFRRRRGLESSGEKLGRRCSEEMEVVVKSPWRGSARGST